MKKYKFKVGQTVYHATTPIYYTSQTKKRQKGPLTVMSRGCTDTGLNVYFLRTAEGQFVVHGETALTPNKEKILGYVLVKGPGDLEVFEKDPELGAEAKVLVVMGSNYE